MTSIKNYYNFISESLRKIEVGDKVLYLGPNFSAYNTICEVVGIYNDGEIYTYDLKTKTGGHFWTGYEYIRRIKKEDDEPSTTKWYRNGKLVKEQKLNERLHVGDMCIFNGKYDASLYGKECEILSLKGEYATVRFKLPHVFIRSFTLLKDLGKIEKEKTKWYRNGKLVKEQKLNERLHVGDKCIYIGNEDVKFANVGDDKECYIIQSIPGDPYHYIAVFNDGSKIITSEKYLDKLDVAITRKISEEDPYGEEIW